MTAKRVLLVDADSQKGFPNLALMKISAWHKERGDSVELIKGIPSTAPLDPYDHTYISCIYFQNKDRVKDYAMQVTNNLMIGGSGYDLELELTDEIEHIMPDYSLYGVDFSIGFTSRGCVRRCPWSVVPDKEGKIRDHAPISEFLHPNHKKIILLDNNFTASPRRYENLHFIRDHNLKVNFSQGLDIRKMNSKLAAALATVKYHDWKFKSRRLHFAFDDMRYEKAVWRGIDLLENAGISPSHLMFYVLVGFNTTEEEDLYRIRSLHKRGVLPYVMPYNKKKESARLTRWVNRRYYQFIPYQEFH